MTDRLAHRRLQRDGDAAAQRRRVLAHERRHRQQLYRHLPQPILPLHAHAAHELEPLAQVAVAHK